MANDHDTVDMSKIIELIGKLGHEAAPVQTRIVSAIADSGARDPNTMMEIIRQQLSGSGVTYGAPTATASVDMGMANLAAAGVSYAAQTNTTVDTFPPQHNLPDMRSREVGGIE